MPLAQETIDGLHESILRDAEAAQILERAAYRVERGWTMGIEAQTCAGAACDPWHPDAIRWCMRAAIQRATLDLGFTTLVVDPEDGSYLQDATRGASSVRAGLRGCGTRDPGAGA